MSFLINENGLLSIEIEPWLPERLIRIKTKKALKASEVKHLDIIRQGLSNILSSSILEFVGQYKDSRHIMEGFPTLQEFVKDLQLTTPNLVDPRPSGFMSPLTAVAHELQCTSRYTVKDCPIPMETVLANPLVKYTFEYCNSIWLQYLTKHGFQVAP